MVPIATGSQTGGSVIRPGAYCGVAALQAVVQAAADHRGEVLLVVARHGRAVRRGRRRRRVCDRRDGRAATCASIAQRRRRRASRCVRTHIWAEASADMQNAVETDRARARSRRREREGRHVAAAARGRLARPHGHHSARGRPLATPSNTTTSASCSDRRPSQCWTRPRPSASMPMTTPAAPRSARGSALADLMGDYDVILTPSAPGAAPHGIGATGRRDLQPALDPDGHALRERAGAERRDPGCRSGCRSSAGSAATAPRWRPRFSPNGRSPGGQ